MKRRNQIHHKVLQFLKRTDWQLLPPVAGVLAFGWWVQWSVAGGDVFPNGHTIRLLATGLALILAAGWSARRWRNSAYLIYALVIAMLVFVLVSGRETNNARRWIDLVGGFKIQPSEFMKLALILFLARWFADRPRLRRLRELWIPGLCCLVPVLLILAEPDLGTALSIGPLFLGMVWLAGLPAKKWRLLVLLPLAFAPLAFLNLKDYQLERMTTWWHQNALTLEEKADAGYHLWHAKMAIGSGRLTGHGWAQGPENRLDRLPERHNDFIFPVIAEEHGFFGASLFLLLYALIPIIALWRAGRYRDPFTRLVIAGVGLHFGIHLVINVGVSTGLLPTTGLPLPMVSFGGSSMAVSGLAVGLALAVGARPGPVFSSRAFEG